MTRLFADLRDNNRYTVSIVLVISCLLSVALNIFRVYYSGEITYVFLLWNLFLAGIPYVISTFFLLYYRSLKPAVVLWMIAVVWLLFFPNAPYIVTDFFHFEPRDNVPYWYDLSLIMSLAWNGLMLGFISLYDMQTAIGRRFGNLKGWFFSVISLVLGSFGIYLGRYERFNSWDVIANPLHLMRDITDKFLNPFSHPRTIFVTALFSVFLGIGYITLVKLIRPEKSSQK